MIRENNLVKAYAARANNTYSLLNTPIFSSCSKQDWEIIQRFTKFRSLKAQEVLFWQNDACHAFYYLVDGYLKLCRRNHKTERVVGFVEPGQIFAESAVFAGDGYPYTAVALEDLELIAVQAYPFARFAQSRPQLTCRFIGHVSRCFHQQLWENEHLATQSAEQKVAAYLLNQCGQNSRENMALRVPKRRIDLASLLTMTPETLCRTLKRFKNANWIKEQSGYITLTDPRALNALLGSEAVVNFRFEDASRRQ
jgi:CRP-like cAMP-binding protein